MQHHKKVLLTGASGFIGRNLKEYLKDYVVLSAPTSNELNLLDAKAVEEYLKQENFQIIIHSANMNNVRKSITPYEALDGNLRMFFNLERCRNYYGKMYYFGSGAEYDMRHYIPDMKEDYFDTYIPADAYGFSKYVMSKACSKNNNIFDLRLFGVYGKYEEWERRFISNAICRALTGKNITLQKNVYFDYLWVEDLCAIVHWFLENEPIHKHYNVCRGEKIDLYTLACMVRNILNIDCDIIIRESGWKPEYTGSNNRLMSEIGTYQFTRLEESVHTLCEFYKDNLDLIDESKLL